MPTVTNATILTQRFESTQATGVSPLVVASTTVVANLNADMVDGQHAAAFALTAHAHAFADLTAKPTTLVGYGITDAAAAGHTHAIESLTTAAGTDGQVWTKGAGGAMAWEDAAGGGGAVDSVFGRTGVVVAVANDYSFAQISGDLTVAQIDATGSPSSTTFLRGDGVWATPPGGGGGLSDAYDSITGDSGAAAASGASGILFTGAGGISTAVAEASPDTLTITLGNHSAALLTTGTLPDARIQASGVTQHQASITGLGTIATGVWNGTAIGPTYGGTGLTSWATGDVPYASASNVLSKLAATTNGFVLTLAAGVPSWAAPAGGGTWRGAKADKNGVSQTDFTNNNTVKITFGSERKDTEGAYASSDFTVPFPCEVLVQCEVYVVVSDTDGVRSLILQRDTVEYERASYAAGSPPGGMQFSTTITCDTGDVLNMALFHDAGSTLTIEGSPIHTWVKYTIVGTV